MTEKLPARRGLDRLGYWCANHRAVVIVGWLVVLVLATIAHHVAGGSYSDNFDLPGSQSQQGADLLSAHEAAAGGQSGQIVFVAPSGATVQAKQNQVESSVEAVQALPHVLNVTDPLSPQTTSKDRSTAFATIHFDTNPVTLGSDYVHEIDQAVAPARSAGLQVEYGGQLGQAARPKPSDASSELIGIAVAIAVLLIGFGSVFAAALPIMSAVLGVFTGLGLLGTAAAAISFGTVSPTLAVMMGLGVGIDYGLFLITRHRQQVMSGRDPRDAAASTVATSGRAVLIAGSTVVIAMLGLYASGVGFIGALGLAAAIAVAVSAVAAVTLVPALLSVAGSRIDRIAVRTPVAESSSDGTDGGWGRYAERIGAHPWRYLTAGAGLLIVLAIPVLSMTLGHVDAGADPQNYTDKRSYDAISSAFGPGTNGPLTIVVELPQGGSAGSLPQTLQTALSGTADVASVTPVTTSPDGALLTTTVIPASSPQDAKTDALLHTLRDTTLPDALSGSGAHGYVTGTTAGQLDFRDIVSARLPIIIAVVIMAAFLLLLASFRSPFLAIKAALLNLLSIGAAYGVVVAVFQWGWGSSAFGVSEKVPVESYVPMMMFAIVFGLSMDYEVFLLARVRETWLATKDNHRAVAHGLAATARVISCAAVIMTSVFLAFLLSTNVVIKMLALGLGISVLVDATVIRLLVVPATMYLAARANWWIPRWLDRILPHLDPEGHPDAVVTAEPPAAAAVTDDAGETDEDATGDDEAPHRGARRRSAPPSPTACLDASTTAATQETAPQAPPQAP